MRDHVAVFGDSHKFFAKRFDFWDRQSWSVEHQVSKIPILRPNGNLMTCFARIRSLLEVLMKELIRHSSNPQFLMTVPISSTNRSSVAIDQLSVRHSSERVNVTPSYARVLSQTVLVGLRLKRARSCCTRMCRINTLFSLTT